VKDDKVIVAVVCAGDWSSVDNWMELGVVWGGFLRTWSVLRVLKVSRDHFLNWMGNLVPKG
jgi:hypothetical protein